MVQVAPSPGDALVQTPCKERPGKELPVNKVRKLNDVMLTLRVTPPQCKEPQEPEDSTPSLTLQPLVCCLHLLLHAYETHSNIKGIKESYGIAMVPGIM